MAKGSSFEREISKQLSLWWTDGKRDDVFWRTSISGGRATVRYGQGKKTFGQQGDIQATDPIGQPLIDVCTIELKRGYSTTTFAGLLDKPDSAVNEPFEKFIIQAQEDHKKAGSLSWLLIVKRDRRKAMIYMPSRFFRGTLFAIRAWSSKASIRYKTKKEKRANITGVLFDEFLKNLSPKDIKIICKNNKR